MMDVLACSEENILLSFYMDNLFFPFSMQQDVLQTRIGLEVIPLKQLKTQL
jgi:hypothetical protein